MVKIKLVLFAAGIVLAMAFTFSCSSDDGGDDNQSSSSVVGESSSSGGGGSSSSGGSDNCPFEADSDNSVTCGGETYNTVRIGEQVWFAKNLNYNAEGSKCYNNDPANCETYGRLYDWATVMALPSSCNSAVCSNQIQAKHKGICPSGWHIPSYDDWEVLMESREFHSFSALPGGIGGPDGSFSSVGNYSQWWSASEFNILTAYGWSITNHDGDGYGYGYGNGVKLFLFSVRCLQD